MIYRKMKNGEQNTGLQADDTRSEALLELRYLSSLEEAEQE